jgi:hypothetical protein
MTKRRNERIEERNELHHPQLSTSGCNSVMDRLMERDNIPPFTGAAPNPTRFLAPELKIRK